MAVGLSAAGYANKVLGHMHRAQASTAPAANYVKLHTNVGDPGAAGTSNPSANTTRVAVTYNTESAGSITSSNTPSWASWASGAETLAYISVWDASTAGTFLMSAALATAKAITNGDTFTLSSLSVTLGPLAA